MLDNIPSEVELLQASVKGNTTAFEAIVKGTDIPEATVPESFRVLIRELNALGLCLEAKGSRSTEEKEKEEAKS